MKKFDLKSIFMGLIAGILATCGVSIASTLVTGDVYFSSYPIYLNGSYYTSSSPILNYNGRTYLPLNELGTVLGSTITFNNNTIYINSYNNNYNDNYYNNYYSKTTEEDIEIEKGESETHYISLSRYGAKSATITGANSYVKVNKTRFTSSGDLKLTGSKVGDATIKVTYNTGDIEKLYVEVIDEDDEYEDEVEMEVGDDYKIYIDLDDYDADEAKVTYDDDYVSVSKTKFTNNGYLTITAEEEGDTTVKIKYDSGDTEYIYIEINEDEYEDEVEMEVGDDYKVYIDLDDYDADEAKVTYDDDYVSVSKTKFTSDGYLTITAEKEGETTVKIKYDSGDTEYIYIEIDDDKNYDKVKLEEDEYEYVHIDLKKYNATSAELSYNSSYIKLNKTTLTDSESIKITGKNSGYTSIKIKFNTGEIAYIDVEVTD